VSLYVRRRLFLNKKKYHYKIKTRTENFGSAVLALTGPLRA
jgi:hypothetical protein